MNYETKLNQRSHTITVDNRKKVEVSGVKKLESLNSNEFIINTDLGLLTICGENLEMVHLDIDKGILWISGEINSLSYNTKDTKTKEKKQSFLGKVFK